MEDFLSNEQLAYENMKKNMVDLLSQLRGVSSGKVLPHFNKEKLRESKRFLHHVLIHQRGNESTIFYCLRDGAGM